MRAAFWITTILAAVFCGLYMVGTVESINGYFDAQRASLGIRPRYGAGSPGTAIGTFIGAFISSFIFPVLGLAIGAHWASKTGDPTGRYRNLRYWCGISGVLAGVFGVGLILLVAWPIGYFIARSVGLRPIPASTIQPMRRPLPPRVANKGRYFALIAGQVKGPYTLDQLSALQDASTITDQTLCCPEGTEEWKELVNVRA